MDPAEIWKATVLATHVGGRQVFRHPCFDAARAAGAGFGCPETEPVSRVTFGGDGCPHGHAHGTRDHGHHGDRHTHHRHDDEDGL